MADGTYNIAQALAIDPTLAKGANFDFLDPKKIKGFADLEARKRINQTIADNAGKDSRVMQRALQRSGTGVEGLNAAILNAGAGQQGQTDRRLTEENNYEYGNTPSTENIPVEAAPATIMSQAIPQQISDPIKDAVAGLGNLTSGAGNTITPQAAAPAAAAPAEAAAPAPAPAPADSDYKMPTTTSGETSGGATDMAGDNRGVMTGWSKPEVVDNIISKALTDNDKDGKPPSKKVVKEVKKEVNDAVEKVLNKGNGTGKKASVLGRAVGSGAGGAGGKTPEAEMGFFDKLMSAFTPEAVKVFYKDKDATATSDDTGDAPTTLGRAVGYGAAGAGGKTPPAASAAKTLPPAASAGGAGGTTNLMTAAAQPQAPAPVTEAQKGEAQAKADMQAQVQAQGTSATSTTPPAGQAGAEPTYEQLMATGMGNKRAQAIIASRKSAADLAQIKATTAGINATTAGTQATTAQTQTLTKSEQLKQDHQYAANLGLLNLSEKGIEQLGDNPRAIEVLGRMTNMPPSFISKMVKENPHGVKSLLEAEKFQNEGFKSQQANLISANQNNINAMNSYNTTIQPLVKQYGEYKAESDLYKGTAETLHNMVYKKNPDGSYVIKDGQPQIDPDKLKNKSTQVAALDLFKNSPTFQNSAKEASARYPNLAGWATQLVSDPYLEVTPAVMRDFIAFSEEQYKASKAKAKTFGQNVDSTSAATHKQLNLKGKPLSVQ